MQIRIMPLEERILLDAAGAISALHAVAATAEAHTESTTSINNSSDSAHNSSDASHAQADPHVLVISSAVTNASSLASAAQDQAHVVMYDPATTSVNELFAKINENLNGQKASSIAFATSGTSGQFDLAKGSSATLFTIATDTNVSTFWKNVGSSLQNGGTIDILGCDVASSAGGLALIAQIQKDSGHNVSASTDATGNASNGGNWMMEVGNRDVSSIYFNSGLTSWNGLLDAPQSLHNFTANTGDSNPANFLVMGSTIYFSANDGIYGTELWKTDGTANGTILAADVNSGAGSSNPSNLISYNNTLYFTADDGSGVGIWSYNGSIASLVPGSKVSPDHLAVSNNLIFFAGTNSAGIELWRTDGINTALLSDINPGFSSSNPTNLYADTVHNVLLFSATDSSGTGLWKSDGTFGAASIVNSSESVLNPHGFVTLGSKVLFAANNSFRGTELFSYDGTSAALVLDINSGSESSNPTNLTVVGSFAYFVATDFNYGSEVWKTDGTQFGTVHVTDINSGPNSSNPTGLTNVNGTLYYAASDGVSGVELWKTNSFDITQRVFDINPGSGSSNPTMITPAGGSNLYFVATDGLNNTVLYQSSGFGVDAVSTASGFLYNPSAILVNGSMVYVVSKDSATGYEIWSSSSGGQFSELKDINSQVNNNIISQVVTDPNTLTNTLYFTANNGNNGLELWMSDGTQGGTILVSDINPGSSSSNPSNLFALNGSLYFAANDGIHGTELWKATGTNAELISDINFIPPGNAGSNPGDFIQVDSHTYFTADNGQGSGRQIYELINDSAVLLGGIGNSNPANLINVGGTLYFSSGTNIYRVIGQNIQQVNGNFSSIYKLANLNGNLIIAADAGTGTGTELFKLSITTPQLIQDINLGSGSSNPNNFTILGNSLYFSAFDGTTTNLYKTDGNSVSSISGGGGLSNISNMLSTGTKIFFTASDAQGNELWITDGINANKVKDINSGIASSNPSSLTYGLGKVYFAADDGSHGVELWSSDGTSAGTTLVYDLNPLGSSLASIVTMNGSVIFSATDGSSFGLWSQFVNQPPTINANSNYSMTDGTSIQISILSNASDPDSASLSLNTIDGISVSQGTINTANGVISNINASAGTFTYTSNFNTFALDDITYTITDGLSSSNLGHIFVDISDALPSTPILQNANLLVNLPAGLTTIGTLVSTDDDLPLQFVLDSGSSTAFSISGDTLYFDATNLSPPNGLQTYTANIYSYNTNNTQSADANFTVTINRAPSFSQDLGFNLNEGNSYNTGGLLLFASDPDGNSLTVSSINGQSPSGTISTQYGVISNINPFSGTFTFTTNEHTGFVQDSFTYTVSDGNLSASSQVIINIAGVNPSAPTLIANNNANVAEGTTADVGTLSSSSADFPIASYHLAPGADSRFSISGNDLIFNANTTYFTNGSNDYSVDVYSQDTQGNISSNGTITVHLTDVAPSVPVGINLNVNEGSPAGTIFGQVTSTDFQAVTLSILNNILPPLFQLSLINGVFQVETLRTVPDYTIASSYTMDVLASDNVGEISSGTIVITINDLNLAPSFTINQPSINAIENSTPQIVSNFIGQVSPAPTLIPPSDEVGQSVIFSIVGNSNSALFSSQPTISADGSILYYTPALFESGSAQITVQAQDNGGTAFGGHDTTTHTFTINILPTINTYTLGGENSLSIAAGQGLLAGISDGGKNLSIAENGSPVSGSAMVSTVHGGTVTINADGSFVYTPAANFSGIDSFEYQAWDGNAASATATANVVVSLSAAVGIDDSYSVNENSTLVVGSTAGLLYNDVNSAGHTNAIQAEILTTVQGGTVLLNADGSFTYQPANNFHGNDSFTYTINDSSDDSEGNSATVNLTVKPISRAPVFSVGANINVLENTGNQSISHWIPNSISGLSNGDTSNINYVIDSANSTNLSNLVSAISVNSSGDLSFTLKPNAFGTAIVKLYAQNSDGSQSSAEQQFTLNVYNTQPPSFNFANATVNVNQDDATNNLTNFINNISPGALGGLGNYQVNIVSNSNPGIFLDQPRFNVHGNSADLVFRPSNDTGSTTIGVQIVDTSISIANGLNQSVTQYFTLNVNPSIQPSYALSPSFSVSSSGTLNISLADLYAASVDPNANDSSIAAIKIIGAPQLGSSIQLAHGTLTYAYDIQGAVQGAEHVYNPFGQVNYFIYTNDGSGITDSFTFKTYDTSGNTSYLSSNAGTVTINIGGSGSSIPHYLVTTNADAGFTVAENGVLYNNTVNQIGQFIPGIPVLSNDTHSSGAAFSPLNTNNFYAILDSGPTHGTLQFNKDGSFTYTPNQNYIGPDGFSYHAFDIINGGSVFVPITVANSTGAIPQVTNPTYHVLENYALTVNSDAGVNSFATLTDQIGTKTAVLLTGPTSGTLDYFNADGSFKYTPADNFSGSVIFTYVIEDVNPNYASPFVSAIATATINVEAVTYVSETTNVNIQGQLVPIFISKDFSAVQPSKELAVANNLLFFAADYQGILQVPSGNGAPTISPVNVDLGNMLWVSDGTAQGTHPLDPSNSQSNMFYNSNPMNLTPVGGELFFTTNPGSSPKLYVTDGTLAGTHLLKTFALGTSLSNLSNVNGTLQFHLNVPNNLPQIWSSDGTAAGTLNTGATTGPDTSVTVLTPTGNNSFTVDSYRFNNNYIAGFGDHTAPALFKNNSLMMKFPSNTLIVGLINSANINGAVNLADTPGMLVFDLYDFNTNTYTAYQSDGTVAGTIPMADQSLASILSKGVDMIADYNGRTYVLHYFRDNFAQFEQQLTVLENAPIGTDHTFTLDMNNSLNSAILNYTTNSTTATISVPNNLSIQEGSTAGVFLTKVNISGSIPITDIRISDNSDALNHTNAFSIDSNNNIFLTNPANLVGHTSLTITVQTTDLLGNFSNNSFNINIVDHPPEISTPVNLSIFDNYGAISVPNSKVMANDSDPISSLVISDNKNIFASSLDNNGNLIIAHPENIHLGDVIVVTAIATDSHNVSTTKTFNVTVVDGTKPTLNVPNNFSLSENAQIGQIVGQISASDSSGIRNIVLFDNSLTKPIANDDFYNLRTNTPLNIATSLGVLGNDLNSSIYSMTAILDLSPSYGTVSLNSDGSFTYTPNQGVVGSDIFSYHILGKTANNQDVISNVALVNLNVLNTNFINTANNYEVTANSSFTGYLKGFPNSGFIYSGSFERLSFAIKDGPQHGTVTQVSSSNLLGQFTYTPDPGFVGDDSFVFTTTLINFLGDTTVGPAVAHIHVDNPNNSGSIFSLDSQGNIILVHPNNLSYANGINPISVTAVAIDNNGLETVKTFQVMVTNDAPTIFTPSDHFTIQINPTQTDVATFGKVITNIEITDKEGISSITLTDDSPDHHAFAIEGDRLVLVNPVELQTGSTHLTNLTITATDIYGASTTKLITITDSYDITFPPLKFINTPVIAVLGDGSVNTGDIIGSVTLIDKIGVLYNRVDTIKVTSSDGGITSPGNTTDLFTAKAELLQGDRLKVNIFINDDPVNYIDRSFTLHLMAIDLDDSSISTTLDVPIVITHPMPEIMYSSFATVAAIPGAGPLIQTAEQVALNIPRSTQLFTFPLNFSQAIGVFFPATHIAYAWELGAQIQISQDSNSSATISEFAPVGTVVDGINNISITQRSERVQTAEMSGTDTNLDIDYPLYSNTKVIYITDDSDPIYHVPAFGVREKLDGTYEIVVTNPEALSHPGPITINIVAIGDLQANIKLGGSNGILNPYIPGVALVVYEDHTIALGAASITINVIDEPILSAPSDIVLDLKELRTQQGAVHIDGISAYNSSGIRDATLIENTGSFALDSQGNTSGFNADLYVTYNSNLEGKTVIPLMYIIHTGDGQGYTKTINIRLVDTTTTDFTVRDDSITIGENTPANSVFNLIGHSPIILGVSDNSDPINHTNAFELGINNNNLVLTHPENIKYTGNPIEVTIYDMSNNGTVMSHSIEVNVINEAPVISVPLTDISINDNLEAGSYLGVNITATDKEGVTRLQISDDSDPIFHTNAFKLDSSGKLYLVNPYNLDLKGLNSTITVTVLASDKWGMTSTETFNVDVTHVAGLPEIIAPRSPLSIPVGASGGTLVGANIKAIGDGAQIRLSDDSDLINHTNAFDISSQGTLYVLNSENIGLKPITVTIQASFDGFQTYSSKTFVVDTREAILVNGPKEAASFHLNNDGTFSYVPLANFIGTDEFSYQTFSSAYGILGNIATVKINVQPQADNLNNDISGISLNGSSVKIQASNINAGIDYAVLSDSSVGNLVGTLNANDPNAGSHSYTYSIVNIMDNLGNAISNAFTISSNELLVGSGFLSAVPYYTVNIHVQDNASAADFYTQSMRIYVSEGLASTPPDSLAALSISFASNNTVNNASVPENALFGTLVGNLNTLNDAGSGPFVYNIVSIDGMTNSNMFIIEGNQLLVGPAQLPDFLTAQSHKVVISTRDIHNNIGTQELLVNVTDVNLAPRFIGGQNIVVLGKPGDQTINVWASNISPSPNGEADEVNQIVNLNVNLANSSNVGSSMFDVAPYFDSSNVLHFTTKEGASGIATIAVYAQDNGGTGNGGNDKSIEQFFTLTINSSLGLSAPIVNNTIALEGSASGSIISNISILQNDQLPMTLEITADDSGGLFAIGGDAATGYKLIVSENGPIPDSLIQGGKTYHLTLRASDAINSVSQQINIFVPDSNHAPSFIKGSDVIIQQNSAQTDFNSWATSNAGPADESSQLLNFIITSNSNPGLFSSLSVDSNGNLHVTPAANQAGTTTIGIKLMDNGGTAYGGKDLSAEQFFTISVNTSPIAQVINAEVDQNTSLVVGNKTLIQLSATDTDTVGTLSYLILNGPTQGTLSNFDSAAGTVMYTPNTSFYGSDSFTYLATDGYGNSNIATANIMVDKLLPIAQRQSYTFPEYNSLTVSAANGLLAGSFDPNGLSLTPQIVNNPSNGIITLDADGGFSYTIRSDLANVFGTDSFTYRVFNGIDYSKNTIVFLNITEAPLNAVDTTYSVSHNGSLALPITQLGSDPNGLPLTATITSQPTHGTLTSDGENGYIYHANGGLFIGTDSFSYILQNPLISSSVVTTTINLTEAAPMVVDDSYSLNSNSSLSVNAASGVLANDTDADGDTLTAVLGSTNVAHGQLTLNADGSFSYTPNANYFGTDSFSYKAFDAFAYSTSEAVVNITINERPLAIDDNYATEENSQIIATLPQGVQSPRYPGVLVNDTDPAHLPITAALVQDVSHGVLHLNANGTFDYTPNTNYYGLDSFTYQAVDSNGASNIATAFITITPYSPNANEDDYTLNTENSTLNIDAANGLLSNDSDPNNLAISAIPDVNDTSDYGGTFTVNADGSFSYTPATNFVGVDHFSYGLTNGQSEDSFGDVFITVNDSIPPVANNDNVTTAEDTPLTISGSSLLANDTDANGFTVSIASFTQPAHGTLVDNQNGNYTYTPNANFNGSDSFTYTITDGTLLSSPATVNISVTPVNDTPVANNDSVTTPEDTAKIISIASLLANDTDIDGDTLSIATFSQPTHGTLVDDQNGTYTYTPALNYNGPDSFTYRATDGFLLSNVATVNINVTPVNDAPVANNNAYAINEDNTLNITAPGVLGNDTDVDGNALTAILNTSTSHGSLTFNSNGSFTYTPVANYNGPDSFTYHANDGQLNSSIATVNITVNSVNDAPSFIKGPNETVNEDAGPQSFANWATAISRGGGADEAGQTLTFIITGNTGLFSVGPAIDANGTLTFTPAPDASGSTTFQVQLKDSGGTSNGGIDTSSPPQSFVINIIPVNDPPTFTKGADQTVLEDAGAQTVVGWATNISRGAANEAGQTVTFNVSNNNAALFSVAPSISPTGILTYTTAPNANGSAIVTVTLSDNGSNTPPNNNTSAPQTFVINVTAVDDAPVAADDSYSINEDTTLNIAAPGVLANDTDIDNSSINAILVSGPSNGSLTLNADGSFSYTPAANFNGSDSFTYKANDGSLDSNEATVNITINAVNDAPVANNDTYATNQDAALNIAAPGILSNDTDVDGDMLGANIYSNPTHGGLILNSDGSFTYTPNAGYYGSDSFQYKANDGILDSNIATVNITINQVAPTAMNDHYNTGENNAISVGAPGVLSNDTNPQLLSVDLTSIVNPTNGSLSINADGSFTYTPNLNFFGNDSFQYKATDGSLISNTATVTITINHINQPPVAVADAYSTNEGTALIKDAAHGVLANDSDPDNDVLSVDLASIINPTHGSLTIASDGSFTYTPNANYFGSDSFQYKAFDGMIDSSSLATVTLTINHTQAPTANNDSYNVNANSSLTVIAPGILANDNNPDNLSLSAILNSGVSHGTLNLNSDGSFTYTPNAGYSGSDSFTYHDNDGTLNSNIATVNISIIQTSIVNANNDSYNVAVNGTLTLAAPGVLANDTDANNLALTASLITNPSHGTLTAFKTTGAFTYKPTAGYTGYDSFTYKATDSAGNFATATVNIKVDSAPVGVIDNYIVAQNGSLNISAASGVLANDTDANNDVLTAALNTNPGHGTVTLNPDGSFLYTPNANYKGADSFTYKASDGFLSSVSTKVNIKVDAAPVAVNDSYNVAKNGVLNVPAKGVLTNDTDANNDPLSAILVTGPSHGSLTLNSDGSFMYVANAGYSGLDSFTYQASDGFLNSNIGTATIKVDNAPVANNDSYKVAMNTTLTISIASGNGVLSNDTDADGDALTAVLINAPSHGTLTTFGTAGNFAYKPTAGYFGYDTFTYQAKDGFLNSNTATVTIYVDAAPVGVADNYIVAQNGSLTISAANGLLANDTDANSDTLTASYVSGIASGTLTLNADGSFTYTPNAGFKGNETFTYKASDGFLSSTATNVTIKVDAAPVAVNDSYTVNSGNTINIPAKGVLANDTDGNNDPLNAILVSGPSNGTLTLNADGSLSYTSNAGYVGNDSFLYKANDGFLDSNIATVNIKVNGAPTAINDTYIIGLNGTLKTSTVTGVLSNDTDPNGDKLTAALVPNYGPSNGTLTLNSNGTFTYKPNAGFYGNDSFSYSASDGSLSSIAMVSIKVDAAPNAIADSYTVVHGNQLIISAGSGVLANDTDLNGDFLSAILVTGPKHGSLILNSDGSFTYTPTTGYIGTDTFTYKDWDGYVYGNTVTVTISIT